MLFIACFRLFWRFWLLSTGSSSTYTQAYDSNGVYTKLSNRELTMVIPNGTMKTHVAVKST